jgi:A-kinase anchor protein 10
VRYINFSFVDSADARLHNIRLHRNLLDILNDKTILSFFVQYLESKNGLPLVKFWLDVETFKAVGDSSSNSERTESRISNYDNAKKERHRKSDGCDTLRDYDCVSISTTTSTSNFDETEETQSNAEDEVDHARSGEIVVISMERMTQSLTDDEKSKICEKNRKNDGCDTKSSSEESRKFQPMILEDALRIYRKYLVTDSTYSVELPALILGKLSLALCGNDPESEIDLNNLWQAFEDAQKHVFDVMEREFLQEFLESTFYGKYMIDVLTSESLCLAEILCSETALFYFMEFLEQDKDNSKLPYLELWLSATNFRKQFDQNEELNNDQLRTDALVIYEKWFSLQATQPLNFSNRTRTRVEEQICSDAFDVLLTCFDEPIKVVEVFLERNCFKKFVKSQLFFKHLSEVMSKVDTNEKNAHSGGQNTSGIIRRNSSFAIKFPTSRHRRTNSESFEKKGVTRSISAQNTLLAGLDYKRNRNSTDLQIDSRLLADPDLLWRRHNSTSKLSFGRVDPYGRFERDFEMPTTIAAGIPTSRSFQLPNDSIDIDDPLSIFEQAKLSSAQSRLKNAVRKLVHLPEDSVQQEIAWQVAELIVKDVTSITLQNESHNA